jgi:PhnB protein
MNPAHDLPQTGIAVNLFSLKKSDDVQANLPMNGWSVLFHSPEGGFLMSVSPIPCGYSSVTPYLIVKGAAQAIEFYAKAFGATEVMRLASPDGTIMHAEIQIGNSMIMLSDEYPDWGANGPTFHNGSPIKLHLYVPDVDSLFAQAVAAGASVKFPLMDQFYGDRTGQVVDPFGHIWSLSTHIEDVSPEEIARRAAEWMSKQAA